MTYDLDELERLEKAYAGISEAGLLTADAVAFAPAVLKAAPAIFARLRKLEAVAEAARPTQDWLEAFGFAWRENEKPGEHPATPYARRLGKALAALDEDAG